MSDEGQRAAISRELPHVIRAMSKGLDPKEKIMMDGPAEKAVAQKHYDIGKTRALMGGAFGGVLGLGAWKSLRSSSKFAGAFLGGSGAFVGAVYGLLSIREEFFVDILSLPDDQSDFAKTARAIIEREMPQSIILKEAYRRMGNLSSNSDSLQTAWEESKRLEKASEQRQMSWESTSNPAIEPFPRQSSPPSIPSPSSAGQAQPKTPKNVFGFPATSKKPSPDSLASGPTTEAAVPPTTWEEIRKRSSGVR
ncbi:hypothetical protein H257_01565 [Aphanomyces astaci]|uniref:Uncharacterized protein n=1 Tax=Aphanomyces astaci TaxID=112090 RepID=W4H8M7_APHAT|nr:hypothetical protein H257_01565 [Aphanomyces astaci]ETV88272.1 hypothetical protein H257_01565 [Aphanomyces astaci]|eukprot:XP_009823135.1 hypothetical protein H257_01565 [Aphanomyces astaci]